MKKNKLAIFLLALVSAVLVWLYDVTVVNPNDALTYTGIPVTFVNEEAMHEHDLMVTYGGDQTVALRIYGRRSELKKLSKANIQVLANLGEIAEAGAHELSYTVRFPANVSAGDLSIEMRSPAYVSVEVEHYIRRAVEVRIVFEGEGSEAGGEALVIDTDAMSISPETVMVTGPAELVETVESARILINRTEIRQTTEASYPFDLLDASGEIIDRDELVTDCDQLTVSIPVLKFKEIPLVLRTQPGGGATDANITYTLSDSTLMISGDAAVVDRFNQLELGTLDYATVTGPTTKLYPVTLPEGINNASGVAEVEATVEVSGLTIMNVPISDFELVNVPPGLTAESISQSVQLTLRGTPAALSSLEPEDVIVTVDLSSFTQPGTFIIPVSVQLPAGLQVGPIGSNTLTVTLS